MEPLYEQDPTSRFNGRAGDYARHRPSYPPAAIDAVLDGLGPAETLTIADVGAGTGISSRLLAERGATVYAIEPNASMRSGAEPHPRVYWLDGSAENLPLEENSASLVACFQAFHWFEPRRALSEFRRVLRAGGRVALVWNERDEKDAFTRRWGDAVRKASDNHPAESRVKTARALFESELFRDAREMRVPGSQALTFEGCLGRIRSTSYLPSSGPAFEELVNTIRQLCEQHADARGEVHLRYEVLIVLAETGL